MYRVNFFLVFLFLTHFTLSGQGFKIEGYVFETGNRGYLNQVEIIIKDVASQIVYCNTNTDQFGQFLCDLPPAGRFLLSAKKESYKLYETEILNKDLKVGEKNFLKIEMVRAPGYLFEITLADKRENEDQIVSAINDYLVEVYNNTTEKEVMKLEHNQSQEFKVSLEKGNHYTILIRKENYLAKQMEVYVNVKDCILCFEGISDVKPGVVDNLTAGNEYGSLLANVEMEKVFTGKQFEIKNIMYAFESAELTKESTKELDKVNNLLKYNPNLTVQLQSHTDSRGSASSNLELSKKRAASAVKYITDNGFVSDKKILAVGLGEEYLKNKCRDGVPCTEAEHSENRRTEIKVTGISDEWIFKPLINIKNEENFEKKLKLELGTSTQVKGEDMPKNASDSSEQIQKKANNSAKEVEKNNKETIITTQNGIEDLYIENGYKLLLYRGNKRLPKESEIIESLVDVKVHIDGFGLIYYLFGNYKSKTEAESKITAELKGSFPKLEIINFQSGRIIED